MIARSRRRRWGLVAVAVLLAAVGWFGWNRDSVEIPIDAVDLGPRPTETRRGRRLTQPEIAAAVLAPQAPSLAPQSLTVTVGTWEYSTYDPVRDGFSTVNASTTQTVSTVGVWPDADEAPFPDHPVTDALLARIFGEEVELSHIVDLADDAGTLLDSPDILDRPWDALMALQIEQYQAIAQQRVDRQAWEARNPLPDRDVVGAKAHWEAYRAIEEPRPDRQYEAMLEASESLLDRWPDHPVADYARLYQLDALSDIFGDTGDVKQLTRASMNALELSSDPLIARAAVLHLANENGDGALDLDRDDLDLLKRAFADLDNSLHRRQLSSVATEAALNADLLDRAGWWLDQNRDLTDTFCATPDDPERSAQSREIHRSICRTFKAKNENYAGYLSAMSGDEPLTWQAGLTAAIRSCYADGHDAPAPFLHAQATWKQGWQWGEWTPPGAGLSGCVATASVAGPTPLAGQVVDVYIRSAK